MNAFNSVIPNFFNVFRLKDIPQRKEVYRTGCVLFPLLRTTNINRRVPVPTSKIDNLFSNIKSENQQKVLGRIKKGLIYPSTKYSN